MKIQNKIFHGTWTNHKGRKQEKQSFQKSFQQSRRTGLFPKISLLIVLSDAVFLNVAEYSPLRHFSVIFSDNLFYFF